MWSQSSCRGSSPLAGRAQGFEACCLEKIATMQFVVCGSAELGMGGVAEETVDSGRLHAYRHRGVYIGTYNRGDLSS